MNERGHIKELIYTIEKNFYKKKIKYEIIIIDDKSMSQSHSSIELVSRIDKIKSQFIEYYESTIDLWLQNEAEDDIILLKDFSILPATAAKVN